MSKVLVAVLIACIAGAAIWFGRSSSSAPKETGVSAPETGTELVEVKSGGQEPSERPDTVSAPGSSLGKPVTPPPVSVAGANLQVTLRVVDAATGQPVVGAEVLGEVDRSRVDMTEADRQRYRDIADDLETLFDTFGEQFKTDAKGEVHLSRPIPRVDWTADLSPSPLRVWLARQGGKYGEGHQRDIDRGVLRIELRRDRSAQVAVLDASGKPALGATVVLRAAPKGQDLASGTRWEFQTDAFGQARLRHLQQHVVGGEQTADLSVLIPGVEASRVPLDVFAPPAVPVVIRLPSTGSMEVTVLGAGGKRLDIPGRVDLLVGGKSVVSKRLRKGLVSYPHVGLGQSYELRLFAGGANAGTTHLSGPVQAGDKVEHAFDLGGNVLVGGSVIDERGLPLSRVGLVLSLQVGVVESQRKVLTDEAGAFAVLVEAGSTGQVLGRVRIRTVSDMSNAQAGLAAERSIDKPFAGSLRLGSFRLLDLPLLLRGRVVDAEGAPILDPLLSARSASSPGSSPTGAGLGRNLAVRVLKGGEFEVRGEALSATITMVLTSARGQKTIECERGDLDLVISDAVESELTAQVIHSGDAPVRVDLALTPQSGAEAVHASSLFPEKTELGSRLTWSGISPGTYRLVGRVMGASQPFVEMDGIEVGEDGKSDPRLEHLVLGEVGQLELVFVDSAWNALDVQLTGVAFVRRSLSHWEGMAVYSKSGNPVLTVPKGGVDLRVCIAGYSPISIFGAKRKTLVRLVKVSVITVPFVIGTGGEVMSVRVAPVSDESVVYSWADGRSDEIDAGGEYRWTEIVAGQVIRLAVPGLGEHRLIVRKKSGSGAYEPVGVQPQTFRVAAGIVPDAIKIRVN